MKSEIEQYWEGQERKILHIRIDNIAPIVENTIEVECTILEDETDFSFIIQLEDDDAY